MKELGRMFKWNCDDVSVIIFILFYSILEHWILEQIQNTCMASIYDVLVLVNEAIISQTPTSNGIDTEFHLYFCILWQNMAVIILAKPEGARGRRDGAQNCHEMLENYERLTAQIVKSVS